MDYDAERRVVVLHGGGLSDTDKKETWTFDGKAWQLGTALGPARRYARLAFDARAKTIVLYGGFDREPSIEIWRFDGGAWTAVR